MSVFKNNFNIYSNVEYSLTALRKLAEHCKFGDMLNDTLRDRLVCGLRNEAAQNKLITEITLTLEKAIISGEMEMAWHQLNSD